MFLTYQARPLDTLTARLLGIRCFPDMLEIAGYPKEMIFEVKSHISRCCHLPPTDNALVLGIQMGTIPEWDNRPFIRQFALSTNIELSFETDK